MAKDFVVVQINGPAGCARSANHSSLFCAR